MTELLLHNARLVTPAGELAPGWLATDGRRIAALGPGQPPSGTPAERLDCDGRMVFPGFIDLHAHGGVGVDVMDADPDGLRRVSRFSATHGVTAWTPTTWTGTQADTIAAVEAIAAATGPVTGGATILGAHMEGPYLNATRCGAQDVSSIRLADRAEVDRLLGTGVVRLLVLAPELEGNRWLIREATRRGVTVSIGHSDATYQQARQAVADGARHVTHTFNAMRPFSHREPGLAGAALTVDELRCELIADNVHVNPVAIDLLVRAKSARGLVLVTDALRPAGQDGTPTADGEDVYDLGGRDAVLADGAVRLTDGTLAGSVLTMDRAVANLHAATGLPLTDLAHASSLGPAQAVGVDSTKGSLEVGKDADLAILDADFSTVLTVVEGEIVYGRGVTPWGSGSEGREPATGRGVTPSFSDPGREPATGRGVTAGPAVHDHANPNDVAARRARDLPAPVNAPQE